MKQKSINPSNKIIKLLIMKVTSLFIILFLPLLLNFCSSEKQPPIIPISDFFENPVKSAFKLSPDGKNISYLESWEKRLNIFVKNIETNEVKRITGTSRDILHYFWVNNDVLVYMMDYEGDEKYQIFSVKKDGKDEKALTNEINGSVNVIQILKNEKDKILVEMNIRGKSFNDVYKLDINTGKYEEIMRNPGNVIMWIPDNSGEIRIAIATDGRKNGILYRDSGSPKFKPLMLIDYYDQFMPLFFSSDNNYIYALSNLNRDKKALVKYDLAKRNETEIVYENPFVDVNNIFWSEKHLKPLAAEYYSEKKEFYFLDKNFEIFLNKIKSNFTDEEVTITDANEDETKFIVKITSDRNPGEYYYYNLLNNEFSKLSTDNPALNKYYLSEMKPISFTSRDGILINGYITLPKGSEQNNLPTVVMPHGGPWLRDTWQYFHLVQFLANRGYAVLQVNYRGSEGYGKKFYTAGFKQWGKKMQDDIDDGLSWMIKQELTNPNKVAIMGYSFGGYAALMGITSYPQKYQCGISMSGPTNLFSILKEIPPSYEPLREMMYEMIGHPVEDSVQLYNTSPYFFAYKVKCPVLISYGINDTQIDYKEIDKYIEDLRKNDVKVTTVFKENEGHHFIIEENRIELFQTIEDFLYRYLGGRTDTKNINNLR